MWTATPRGHQVKSIQTVDPSEVNFSIPMWPAVILPGHSANPPGSLTDFQLLLFLSIFCFLLSYFTIFTSLPAFKHFNSTHKGLWVIKGVINTRQREERRRGAPPRGPCNHRSAEQGKAMGLSTDHSRPHKPCGGGRHHQACLSSRYSHSDFTLGLTHCSGPRGRHMLKTAEWALDNKAPPLTAGPFSSLHLNIPPKTVHSLLPESTENP